MTEKKEGNNKAMREALECALAVLDGFGYAHPDCVRAAYDCKAALASPPRNCDIGTAEEQEKRFETFCNNHFSNPLECGCEDCPCRIPSKDIRCEFAWAQMPYERRIEE